MIAIEKNVPIPEPGAKYPWAEMNPGDAIWISEADDPRRSNGNAVNSARQWLARNRPEWKLTARSVEKNGEMGVRIWFTE